MRSCTSDMSYYGAWTDFTRHNYKLPYRSLSYAVFKPCSNRVFKPCTTLFNRYGNDNTVRCKSNVRFRSYRTYSNCQDQTFKHNCPKDVSSKYRTNSVGSRGNGMYHRDYYTGRAVSVTPCTTRYERFGGKEDYHCSDNRLGNVKNMTNYIECRRASVTPYTTRYERMGLKDDCHCSDNNGKNSDSSATVIAKDPYTNILTEQSDYSIINKPRAVSYENKLTQTKGSDIDRALAKAVESTHDKNEASRAKNTESRTNRKTTTSKLNVNRESRRKTISKLNTNVETRLTRNRSNESVNLVDHSTMENLRDQKSEDIVNNNKQRQRSKKNLFVRFMNFGQPWSKLSPNGETGSFIESKKKLRERRENRKKTKNKTIQNSVSTQSTPLTSGKISHPWNKIYQVSNVSIDNVNDSIQTLVPPRNENNFADDIIEYPYDGNKKKAREERKIYYDEHGRKLYDDEGRKINYKKHKDDTDESSKNYSRRRKSKENNGDGINHEDTREKNDKTEEFSTKKSSPKKRADKRSSYRRDRRRGSKDTKDLTRTDSHITNMSERPENSLYSIRNKKFTNRKNRYKKERWSQPSPTGSNVTITSITRTEYKGKDGVSRLLDSSTTKTSIGRCKTCTSRKSSRNRRDDSSVTFITTDIVRNSSGVRHGRQNPVEDLKHRIANIRKSCHNYRRQTSVDSKVGDYKVEQRRVTYEMDGMMGGEWNNLEERYKRIVERNHLNTNPEPLPICRVSSMPKYSHTNGTAMQMPKTWLKIPPRKSPLSYKQHKKQYGDVLPILRIRI
ncbi:hypothetical protein WDU94_004690 [Cyamophila willieti]